VPVTDFKAGTVKKETINKFIEKQKPKLIFFNGHGAKIVLREKKERL